MVEGSKELLAGGYEMRHCVPRIIERRRSEEHMTLTMRGSEYMLVVYLGLSIQAIGTYKEEQTYDEYLGKLIGNTFDVESTHTFDFL